MGVSRWQQGRADRYDPEMIDPPKPKYKEAATELSSGYKILLELKTNLSGAGFLHRRFLIVQT
jgi:hypothetical protein